MLGRILFAGTLLVAFSGGCSAPSTERGQTSEEPPIVWKPGSWNIVWQDEFDGPAGQAPDKTHWAHETRGNGGGNPKLQEYTDSTRQVGLHRPGKHPINPPAGSILG